MRTTKLTRCLAFGLFPLSCIALIFGAGMMVGRRMSDDQWRASVKPIFLLHKQGQMEADTATPKRLEAYLNPRHTIVRAVHRAPRAWQERTLYID